MGCHPMIRLHRMTRGRDFAHVIKVPDHCLETNPKEDRPGWALLNQVISFKSVKKSENLKARDPPPVMEGAN